MHKTVLSLLSWLAFGALLLGRWRRGWRSATAVRWTLGAMALLVLAFFGSKFVLELVTCSAPADGIRCNGDICIDKILHGLAMPTHDHPRHPCRSLPAPPSACCSARPATPCGHGWNASSPPPACELNFSQFITLKRLSAGPAGVTDLARAADLNPGR